MSPSTPISPPPIYSYPSWTSELSTGSPEGTYTPYSASEKGVLVGPDPSKLRRDGGTNGSRKGRNWIIAAVVLAVILVAAGVGAGVAVSNGHKNSTLVAAASSSSAAGAAVNVQSTGTSTATAVAAASTENSTAGLARRLVTFGASYCDNGHPRALAYNSSLHLPPYYKGRWSNGIVWDEYLASLIAPSGTTTDQINMAYAGAMVDNSIDWAKVPDVKTQMTTFLSNLTSGSIPSLPTGSKTLIAVWIGINPILDTYTTWASGTLTSSGTQSGLNNMNHTVSSLLSSLSSLRTSLVSSGVDATFLVLPNPPVELLPYAVYTAGGNAAKLAFFKNLAKRFNAVLKAGLVGLKNTDGSQALTYDMETFYYDLVANPSLGNVTISNAACVTGTSTVCSHPENYLFWDSIHMTTKIHSYVASTLAPVVNRHWAS
ncbi:hypothetical protein MNV49_004712 [Pseudohyphozyma bogoriensis]|nr:hypothetical protein MNV49_004712 [Pseudohyphozyma bogoriensis]